MKSKNTNLKSLLLNYSTQNDYIPSPLSLSSSTIEIKTFSIKACFFCSFNGYNAQIQSEVNLCHKSIAPALSIFCRLHRRPHWISIACF